MQAEEKVSAPPGTGGREDGHATQMPSPEKVLRQIAVYLNPLETTALCISLA